MERLLQAGLGILLPFLGTAAGAAGVFFLRRSPKEGVKKALPGFAAGVMLAASVWSLLIPAEEMGGWLPALCGFLWGVGFLLILDGAAPLLWKGTGEPPEGRRRSLLLFAVTLHNLPEGMAVGVAFAGALAEESTVTMAGAFALSVGITLQNLPEGAIVSAPSLSEGSSKGRAFWKGVLSGVVEPVGGAAALALSAAVGAVLPYVLAFAAGAMVYVAVRELIPESRGVAGTVFLALGFAVMMALDMAL